MLSSTRMTRLHDITQRRICRAAFLAAAVVPTLAVLGWAAAANRPGRVAAYEHFLRQHLRLAVSLEAIEYPRPGHTLLRGLRISDPESGDSVLTCPVIETARHDDRIIVVASPLELNVRRLGLLADVVRRRMRDVADGGEPGVRFVAHGITLSNDNLRQTFTDVVGGVQRGAGAVDASLQFRLAGEPKAELGRIRISLSCAAENTSRASVELHTGGSPIPLPPLVAIWPALAHLGDTAEFRGAVWAREEPSGWHGETSGQLSAVDLTRLVTEQFPHKLSGIARVTIDNAKFHDSRLVEATLRLESDGGQIEHSLLAAAQTHLGLVPRKSPASGDRFHTYTKLRLWAELGSGQLTLRASEGAATRGVILADANGALLHESAAGPQPIANLVRALVPQQEIFVPASLQTEALLPRLPLSERQPLKAENNSPRSRIRL
jgi:hypothetical protein